MDNNFANNPNAHILQLKSMLDNFQKLVPGGDAMKFASSILDVKKKYKFSVNNKQAELAVMNNGLIYLTVEGQEQADVEEIVRRLLSND